MRIGQKEVRAWKRGQTRIILSGKWAAQQMYNNLVAETGEEPFVHAPSGARGRWTVVSVLSDVDLLRLLFKLPATMTRKILALDFRSGLDLSE